jgi:hypothetical protein
MTAMTVSALLAMISTQSCVPPDMARVMAGIALHENPRLDTAAVNHNPNGTLDVGIAQVNTSNFGWTGLTMATAMDPCRNLAAAMKILFVRYNGAPPDAAKVTYANGTIAAIREVGAEPPLEKQHVDPDDPQPPAWDMEAVADWRRRHVPTAEDAAEAPAVYPAPAMAKLIPKKEPK